MSITIFNVNIVFSSLKDKLYLKLVALNQAAMASRFTSIHIRQALWVE